MNIRSAKTLIFLLVTLSMLMACELPGLPLTVAPRPTSDSNSIQTIVVATAGAAQTQTALVLPSPTSTSTPTLVPTATSTETGTPTATVIFIIPTKTFTPSPTKAFETQSAGKGCELTAQTPGNDTAYGARERFNVSWTVRNTGTETWFGDAVDFFYSSGRDMHSSDILDLPGNVPAGQDVNLTVEMRAPAEPGTYTTNWTLGNKKGALCIVSVRIIVK